MSRSSLVARLVSDLAPIALAAVALATLVFTAPAGRVAAQVMDRVTYTYVAVDELEYAPGAEERPLALDSELWHGGDYNRLWVKVEAERSTVDHAGEYELQLLYGRFVASFWDAQVGLRFDARRGPDETDGRAHLVVGLDGLAPYWFEVEPALFLSHEGHVSARLEVSYDLLFTQRLILEPDVEFNVALQEVSEWEVGNGLNDVELSARLRYEIVRELAPYVGFSWERRIGETADLVQAGGGAVSDGTFVLGIRAWW